MPYIAIGLLLLLLLLYFGRHFTKADVRVLARVMRTTGGVLALAGAVFFFVTGRAALAVPLIMLAYSLLGRGSSFPWAQTEKSPGQKSTVRTATIEMELDHDTGEMRGTVLSGPFAGRALGSLSLAEAVSLWDHCRVTDPQGAQLLEAMLDRAQPDWRELHGIGGRENSAEPPTGAGKMTVREAYDILGLRPGASRDDINRAHRELMKRFHPDQGGSNYIAAKINEAKDLLLKQSGL